MFVGKAAGWECVPEFKFNVGLDVPEIRPCDAKSTVG